MRKQRIGASAGAEDLRVLDDLIRRRVSPSRSALARGAVDDKLLRLGRVRLAAECARLDREEEQAAAESFFVGAPSWPY